MSQDVASPAAQSPAQIAAEASLSSYYNASHLRTDTWDHLKVTAERLRRAAESGRSTEELHREAEQAFRLLRPIESYWAFPGKHLLAELRRLLEQKRYPALAGQTARLVRLLVSGTYRHLDLTRGHVLDDEELENENVRGLASSESEARPYFEVLLVDSLSPREEDEVRERLLELRDDRDDFVYDVVVAPSFEDALIAVLFNYNIQSCVVRYSFPFESEHALEPLQQYVAMLDAEELERARDQDEISIALGRVIQRLRPELDQFLVTDAPIEDLAGGLRLAFRRVFYRQEDYRELHLSILKGITERYDTPFFNALLQYSQKPTGVFHAMPISRGKSIDKSHWIKDMGRFYGSNIFLAESSATTGGLDSLLQPLGPLKRAQKLAGRAYGSRRTYFVTNGTSTANKIVVQALVRPGDVVLVDRDCHKSHHYALLLAGACPLYMDSYPLSEYSFYGAVPLETIKGHLRELEAAGKLDRVRMVLLTNCTFDGLTYHPEKVMREILAIKPDMIFLWDEAWFGFASFNPTLRRRTAIESARRLRELFKDEEYRERYRSASEREGLPDPESARVRVYATQSTHKTLTALRQGSMIHIHDQDFEEKVYDAFHEAYMTHTSTSPNYQILASLDVGRRQVELEGYEMVQKSLELAMTLREKVTSHPLLSRYFEILGPAEIIPKEFRPSKLQYYFDPEAGWNRMERAWMRDEFALEPTRITLHVGRTGMDGATFRQHLMDHYDIQINKTSRNTVLFMVHIGTTRGSIAYLIEVLTRIAEELDERLEEQNPVQKRLHEQKVRSLCEEHPPLPDFSYFHKSFLSQPDSTTPEGDMRSAYFLAYDHAACEYLPLGGSAEEAVDGGREVVSASFVTPYPPGFPILVPGQVVSPEILSYLDALDVKEIHGYAPEYGLRVFTEDALAERLDAGSS